MGYVLGKIEIQVMRDGRCPMRVSPELDEWQILNVLSSLVQEINERMVYPRKLLFDQETKKRLYFALAEIFGTEDGFPMINALAWCINRIAKKMEVDKAKKEPMILRPDVMGGGFA